MSVAKLVVQNDGGVASLVVILSDGGVVPCRRCVDRQAEPLHPATDGAACDLKPETGSRLRIAAHKPAVGLESQVFRARGVNARPHTNIRGCGEKKTEGAGTAPVLVGDGLVVGNRHLRVTGFHRIEGAVAPFRELCHPRHDAS